MTQQRWFCHVCRREWVFARLIADGICPAPDCHAVGFVERITFDGRYDSTTSADIHAAVLADVGAAKLAKEDAHRATLIAVVEFSEPPLTLVSA